MTDYTKTTNFTAKDSLPSGNAAKKILGSLFDTEFDNIQTAVNTKYDSSDLGVTLQAYGAVLDDINAVGANAADGEVLVGTGAGALAWESGATLRTSLGLGTGDSPTFSGLTLDRDTDAVGLLIDSEATTANGVSVFCDVMTSGVGVYSYTNSSAFAGYAFRGIIDHTSATGMVARFDNDGTGDTVFVDVNGNAVGLNIDSEATTATALNMDCAATTGECQVINAPSLTSGRALSVYTTNPAFANSNGLVRFQISDGSATGVCLRVQNSGTGNGAFIDQNGNGIALNIDSEATTSSALKVDGAATSGYLIESYNNNASFSGRMLSTHIDHASATGVGVYVVNDGTGNGAFIDQNGDGISLNIDSEATTAAGIRVASDAATTGDVIYGSTAQSTYQGNVIRGEVNGASATGRAAYFKNVGTGNGVMIDQDGNGVGLNIDSEATTATAVVVDVPCNNFVADFTNSHATAPHGLELNFSAASPDNNTQIFLRCFDNTTARCYIYSDGDVVNHDGTYGTISDRKLKTDEESAPSYWEDFKSLNYKKYRMLSDVEQYGPSCEMRLGLVAQEVEQVFPTCVKESPDMEEVVVGVNKVPVLETVEIPAVVDGEGAVITPSRKETRQKVVNGNPVFESTPITETRQKTDEQGNPLTTKFVKSSVIDGTIAAVVLQEAMARIEALEAQVAALQPV